jgi:hypothetical protein
MGGRGYRVAGGCEQDGSLAGFVPYVTSDWKMGPVGIDRIAVEVEIALPVPCFLLCAVRSQVRDFASIEDMLLSFLHDTTPFCGIDCVQTHPDRVLDFRRNGFRRTWRTYELPG